MSTDNSQPIENAEEVIERFGGIRPMAKKIDMAVTTVQGWKKRGVIPGNRRDMVMNAAAAHDVDLTGLLGDGANENEKPLAFAAVDETIHEGNDEGNVSPAPSTEEALNISIAPAGEAQTAPEASTPEALTSAAPDQTLEKRLKQIERRAVTKSTLITIILLGAALGGAYYVLQPFSAKELPPQIPVLEGQVNGLQQELNTVKEEQRSLRDLIPSDFRDRFGALKQQTESAQVALGAAIERAEALSQSMQDNVLGQGAGDIEQRLSALERVLGDFVGSAQMDTLMDRLSVLQNSALGQQQLDQSVNELSAIVMSTEGEETQFDAALESARGQSTALSQTFEGVPSQDLKAAAMLLAFSQMREALNRQNEPFEDDLVLLMNFVGEEDAALKASLERLSPHANRGVLSPEGLSAELRNIAGDAVVASLQGEDVSVTEKAKARFNEIFALEKDGELVTGTPVQAQLNETQKQLDQGNLEAAIAAASAIDGPAAAIVAPWLQKAQATLAAKQTDSIIDQVLSSNLKAAAGQVMDAVSGGEMYYNPETGTRIYKPANRGFKDLKLPGAP